MNRKNIITLILALLYILISGFKPAEPKAKRIVVIDAGHGGKDTGALGLHSKEKDILLSIAKKVGAYIEQNISDVTVIYTRKTDVFIPLDERANIANKNNADLFISIHANSNSNVKAYGTDSFVMGLHKTKGNLEVAQKENSVIVFEEDYNVKYEGFDPNSAESYIIFSLMQNAYLDQSLTMASLIQSEFREKAKRKDRGVKQAGFLVLWHTSMPSVLVETGFVSNPEEEQFLLSDQGQEYIASAIYRSVKTFFNELGLTDSDLNINAPTDEFNDDIKPATKDSATKETQIADNKPELKATDAVIFRVQVLSSSKKIEEKTGIFQNYTDIYEYMENDMYKYALGNYTNINDAKKFQESLKNDYPDSFIVTFKNGVRIPISQALKN